MGTFHRHKDFDELYIISKIYLKLLHFQKKKHYLVSLAIIFKLFGDQG